METGQNAPPPPPPPGALEQALSAFARWAIQAQWQSDRRLAHSLNALHALHARYKYLLMACQPLAYQQLGKQLGSCHALTPTFLDTYRRHLLQALACIGSRGTHSNALQHMAGYLKRSLDATERQSLQQAIDGYRQGQHDLEVPWQRLRDAFEQSPHPYILGQFYLYPPRLSLQANVRPGTGVILIPRSPECGN